MNMISINYSENSSACLQAMASTAEKYKASTYPTFDCDFERVFDEYNQLVFILWQLQPTSYLDIWHQNGLLIYVSPSKRAQTIS